jgi:hypothetical protein
MVHDAIAYAPYKLQFINQTYTAYEFTVANTHNYFVGVDGVLVHNCKLLPAPNKAPNMLSRGSTGRVDPRNLQEKLAMDEVMNNPQGKVLESIQMTDKRWPASEGWVKMQQIVESSQGKVNIHYLKNVRTGVVDDFKFKGN